MHEGLAANDHNPGAIRSRIPSNLASKAVRAVVCAIRNPEATIEELAATAGVTPRDLWNGLAAVAEDRHPLADDHTGVTEALYDVLTADGLDPETVVGDDDRLQSVTTSVGRRAQQAVNAAYIKRLLTRDDATRQCDAVRIDAIVTDRVDTRHGLEELAASIGLRRVLEALGERPAANNLDRIMASTSDTDTDVGITTDYIIAEDHWTADDLSPGVAYSATVNNKEAYGIFVSLAGRGPDDISGLIHRKQLPNMLSVDDFHRGDKVLVKLIKRRANGDLGFALAGVIDALNLPAQEFVTTAEFQGLGEAADVDEDELIEQAQAAADAPQEAEAAPESPPDAGDDETPADEVHGRIRANTSHHEALYALARTLADADDDAAITVRTIQDRYEDVLHPSTLAGAITILSGRGLIDRIDIDGSPRGGDAKFALQLNDWGREMLDELGVPVSIEAPPAASDAAPEEQKADTEPPGDTTPQTDMDTTTDEQTADESTPTDDPTPTERSLADDDFAGDVMMMAGMAIGRGDLSPEEAAASLRNVAARLERGGPTTWS